MEVAVHTVVCSRELVQCGKKLDDPQPSSYLVMPENVCQMNVDTALTCGT